MIVRLPFPAKALWSNGRPGNHHQKARELKKHREWAFYATLDALVQQGRPDCTPPIRTAITLYPKSKGPLPDALNVDGACKAYFDGIADALKLNDRDFAAPTVAFGPREARIEITLGPIQNGDQP